MVVCLSGFWPVMNQGFTLKKLGLAQHPADPGWIDGEMENRSREKLENVGPWIFSDKRTVFLFFSSLLADIQRRYVYLWIQMKQKVREGNAPSHNVTAASYTAVSHLSLYGQ